ncbi:hypothetical protein CBW54_00485 [Yersinia kristensenii]|nr:hypothetical protein CBW54_00485 [Yersinia kristensenii]
MLATFPHPNHLLIVSSLGFVHLLPCCNANDFGGILILDATAVLATFPHPNHLLIVSSLGFVHLLPCCNALIHLRSCSTPRVRC